MFRPFLLICALFACLGVSSACLTTKEWMSILPEDSKKQDELWVKAKTGKQCSKAMEYSMKEMPEMSAENSKVWVQLAVEFIGELQNAKGNTQKAIKSYTKACASKGYNKALKEMGYSNKGIKALDKCWATSDLKDLSPVIKQAIKWGQGLLKDPSQLAPLMSAVLQVPAFQPLLATALPLLCTSSA